MLHFTGFFTDWCLPLTPTSSSSRRTNTQQMTSHWRRTMHTWWMCKNWMHTSRQHHQSRQQRWERIIKILSGKDIWPWQRHPCNTAFRATDAANRRGNQHYTATGIGGCNCARHLMNQKCGFADLQLGEKWVWEMSVGRKKLLTCKTDMSTWTMQCSPH